MSPDPSDAPEPRRLKPEAAPSGLTFGRSDLLRWIYLGRLTVVSGILVGALYQWLDAEPRQTLVATVMFILALAASTVSFWYTHVLHREPGENFLYGQVVLDVLLATGIVHVTGGAESSFAPLYVLVIGEGALLLPLPGGVLIGGLASILYVADIFWLQDLGISGAAEAGVSRELEPAVLYQIGLFVFVAFVTGVLGDRLRRAGIAVGAVASELRQLRLDTGEILANVPTGVLSVDGTGRLAYLNPAGESMLGIEARQWLGAPIVNVVDEVAPGMGMVLRRSIEDGVPVSRFKTVASKAGESRVLGVSTAVLERAEGSPPSATAIFQDITDLERVEALNRRTARLEAVAELSASLAHEIKNPLASIRSSVEQLSRSGLGGGDRQTLEELILGESDRLSRLLSEFLEFSGLRMGRSRTVDVVDLVRECLAVVRQHPDAANGVRITREGGDESISIVGDADLLHRAVFNLILNAVQFSAPEGEVTVEVGRAGAKVPAEAADVADPVFLAIRDTGPGVPESERGRIFDPFYTTRSGGSGLGLAVVHRAVEAHQGAVLVGDRAEGGAEFVIYLPGLDAPTEPSREVS